MSPSSPPLRTPHPVLPDYYPDAASRQESINALFDAGARHYDWIDRWMSFGTGRRYRREALQRHGVGPGLRVADVGTGTGVIALLAQELVGPAGEVVAVDPSPGMLDAARRAGVRDVREGRGDALPLPDAHFDLVTMSYALRHVADLGAAFREYRRVLRPGGRVLLLEITPPEGRLAYHFLRFYMRTLVPGITRLARRSREAQRMMRYYWDTVETCVPPADILAALGEAGLAGADRHVELRIFSEYTATRPDA